jgi:hypothetical protein
MDLPFSAMNLQKITKYYGLYKYHVIKFQISIFNQYKLKANDVGDPRSMVVHKHQAVRMLTHFVP